jgi:thiopurine S-methyltransferase
MLWLHEQGHRVLGVELSAKAASAFFTENNLCANRELDGDFEVFTGTGPAVGLTLLVGDYFALTAEQVKECGLFYDRASLIALPQPMRRDYARHLARLMPERSRGLLLSIAYNESKMNGPPFSVPDSEVCELLQENFSLTQLARFEGPRYVGNLAERGLETLEERVYLLSRNRKS